MEITNKFVKIRYCENEGCAARVKHYKDKCYELQDRISELELENIKLTKQIGDLLNADK